MQESQESTNSDKVLILPLSEDSRKITLALSNEKAMKVLGALTDKAMSATDVATNLGMPLTTVKYNIDSLVEADLLKVKDTKWSKKGREIKIYEPVQKFIVVAPGSMRNDKNSILSMLKRYLGLVAGALFAATGLEAITRNSNMQFAAMPAQEAMSYDLNAEPTLFESTKEAVMDEEFVPEDAMDTTTYQDVESEVTTLENMPDSDFQPGLMKDVRTIDAEIPEAASPYMANESMHADPGMINEAYDGADLDTISQIPAEGAAIAGDQATGFIPELLSHASVWFLFGCLFIIAFLLMREVYYRKKNI
jgi:predicted ArsR family transcriptional regulator